VEQTVKAKVKEVSNVLRINRLVGLLFPLGLIILVLPQAQRSFNVRFFEHASHCTD
jgi:hypothetical protein